jgi:multisubunit Na+/H+ antiporter MnhF subunit
VTGFLAYVVPLAVVWLCLLLVVLVVVLLRARIPLERILALDVLAVVLAALLGTIALDRRTSYFLDGAGLIALLSFVETLAAARFWGRTGNGSPGQPE